ncbi:MAG: DUF2079 domain-containing protein [bacterium]
MATMSWILAACCGYVIWQWVAPGPTTGVLQDPGPFQTGMVLGDLVLLALVVGGLFAKSLSRSPYKTPLITIAVSMLGCALVSSRLPYAGGQVLFQLRIMSNDLLARLPLVTFGGIVIGLVAVASQREEPDPKRRCTVPAVVGLLASLLLADLLRIGLLRHATFHSNAYDLGIFTQLFWNLTHHGWLASSIREESWILRDHAAPTWWLLAPLWSLVPRPETLIVLQWLILASGAIPLYLLTRRRTESSELPWLMVAAYCAYPPLHWLGLFDVHEVCLAVPLILWVVWAWEEERWTGFWILAVLLIGVKEELGIVTGMLGLVLSWKSAHYKKGLGLMALGFGWFLIYAAVIQPAIRADGLYYYVHRYAYLGDSMGAILVSLVTKPGLWLPHFTELRPWFFVAMLILPLAGLPLLSPRWLLVLLPTFLYSVLSVEPLQTSIYAQYTAPYIPILFLATLDGVRPDHPFWARFLPQLAEQRKLLALVPITAFVTGLYLSPLAHGHGRMERWLWTAPQDAKVAEWIASGAIPTDASVSASSKYLPHLATRTNAWRFPSHAEDADYVLVDMQEEINSTIWEQPPLRSGFKSRQALSALLIAKGVGSGPRGPADRDWIEQAANPNFEEGFIYGREPKLETIFEDQAYETTMISYTTPLLSGFSPSVAAFTSIKRTGDVLAPYELTPYDLVGVQAGGLGLTNVSDMRQGPLTLPYVPDFAPWTHQHGFPGLPTNEALMRVIPIPDTWGLSDEEYVLDQVALKVFVSP